MQYLEDQLEQFMYNPSKEDSSIKQKSNSKDKVTTNPSIKQQKKQKNKTQTQLNTVQEMNFKYIWDFLRDKQDSDQIRVADIIKAVSVVMKKPFEEQSILEMININNEKMYLENHQELNETISYEELKAIFIECKLKI